MALQLSYVHISLLYIVLYLHICTIAQHTSITTTTWDDDFSDDSPLPGWSYTDTHSINSNDPYTSGNTQYHGPYIGKSPGGTTYLFTIERQFKCTAASSVSVNYNFYGCGTGGADFTRLVLGGTTYSIAGNAYKSSYSDSTLAAATPTCTGWKEFGSLPTYTIPSVAADQLFTVRFQSKVTNYDEAMAISSIQITCNAFPTIAPTFNPTQNPIKNPTKTPTSIPTQNPVKDPTKNPTQIPSRNPTKNPTQSPSRNPTKNPTQNPSKNPTTSSPTTAIPTSNPTPAPTSNPTPSPTSNPTPSPTSNPTPSPTDIPTASGNPTTYPTDSTNSPTPSPTFNPTPSPTSNPTPSPTENPLSPLDPTYSPTAITKQPTPSPTDNPTPSPTDNPTPSPTDNPTPSPSNNPTYSPTSITKQPTTSPTSPTAQPTERPSQQGLSIGSKSPSKTPTNTPTTTTISSATKASSSTDPKTDAETATFLHTFMDKLIVILLLIVIICCMAFSITIIRNRKQKFKKSDKSNSNKNDKTTDIIRANTVGGQNPLTLAKQIGIRSNSRSISIHKIRAKLYNRTSFSDVLMHNGPNNNNYDHIDAIQMSKFNVAHNGEPNDNNPHNDPPISPTDGDGTAEELYDLDICEQNNYDHGYWMFQNNKSADNLHDQQRNDGKSDLVIYKMEGVEHALPVTPYADGDGDKYITKQNISDNNGLNVLQNESVHHTTTGGLSDDDDDDDDDDDEYETKPNMINMPVRVFMHSIKVNALPNLPKTPVIEKGDELNSEVMDTQNNKNMNHMNHIMIGNERIDKIPDV